MKFTKMHGCGNDYIFVDSLNHLISSKEKENLPKITVALSDRRTGIGADGLILIGPSGNADFSMAIYNADGSMAEMCGNGIRCVGKYVYDHGFTDQTKLTIETKAGIKTLFLNVENGCVKSVRVDMGKPILNPKEIGLNYIGSKERIIDHTIETNGYFTQITCVSMGNPHAVIFEPDILRTDIKTIGPIIEHHPFFPQRTNVEFVHVIDRDTIEMRVWERGTGETFACGTGSCASVVAAILHGYINDAVNVQLLGGELYIEYDRTLNTVFMTGPAITVFDGETKEMKG